MSNPLNIPGVTYHGGFSFLPEVTRAGRLVLDDQALTLDHIVHETLTRNFDPPLELCRTRAVASIEVTSEQVAKSNMFGIVGYVTTRRTKDRATLVLTLKSGEVGYLTVDGVSTAQLLGTVRPWLRDYEIEIGSSSSSPQAAIERPQSLADELVKLNELHTSGALSEEEFMAAKARLLG